MGSLINFLSYGKLRLSMYVKLGCGGVGCTILAMCGG